MKKWLYHTGTIALLFLMLMKTASMPLVLIDFAINQDFIARTFCENKAKPAMHCNGKCYMKKKLAQSSDNSEAPASHNNSRTLLLDVAEPARGLFFTLPSAVLSGGWITYLTHLPFAAAAQLLRPPIA